MKDQMKRKLETDPLNDGENHEVSKKKKLKKDKQMKKQKEQNTHTAENKTQEETMSSKSENIDNKQDEMKELKKKKKKQKQNRVEGNINKVMDNTVEKENTGMTGIKESKKKKKNKLTENEIIIEQNKVEDESVESGVEQVDNVNNKNKKKKNILEKEDSENVVDQSHINEKMKKKKEKQKKKKNKELKPDAKENLTENPEEIKEGVTEKDSQNDELIYNLLGDRPDKISTLNGFQKKLIRLSLLAANDVEKSDDQIEVVTKIKEKHKQEFRKAVDRGISKGLTVDYIDTGHSRSVKFEDSD